MAVACLELKEVVAEVDGSVVVLDFVVSWKWIVW